MAETEGNNGNEATSEASSSLEKKIIRQIEFYFGDANLRRDRFMQLKLREDDGWISLDVMLTFNRLADISKDKDVILTALGKSKAGLMEISEDKSKIRRSPKKPLPEENADYMMSLRDRTVYCKGFPLDATMDTLQTFMDVYGETESISLRRDKERNFKGSIFAVYKTREDALKFMKPESLKFGETETIRYRKSDYYKMKGEERKTKKDEASKQKKQQRDKREQETVEATTEYKDYEKGLVLYFTGASDQTSREDLKEVFGDYATVSWVDFDRGKTEGSIRFDDNGPKAEEVMNKCLDEHLNKLEIRGSQLTMRVLGGEEEEEHWKNVFENRARMRMRKHQGKRRNFNKGKGDRRDSRNVRYEGKKTVFEGKSEEKSSEAKQETAKIEDDTTKDTATAKRPLEEASSTVDEPSAKQIKTAE